jgi:hypothetical protein
MKTFFSALLTAVLFIIAPITNAALYQGTITGTASIWPGYSAPFNDGDPFTLTLLVDTAGLNDLDPSVNGGFYESVSSGIQLLLNIGGYTGTFENFLLQIQNDDSGTTDSFSIVTPLDVSGNIFNGSLANLGLSFLGPTSVLQDGSLVQSFAFTDFTTESNISFDANFIEYAANLTTTSGSYAAVVPIPAALYLFAPALAGLVTLARRKKK